MALEFLSNAWRTGAKKPTRIVQVRGKEVKYTPGAINKLFNFYVPEVCTLKGKRDVKSNVTMEKMETLKSQLCVPNADWVKPSRKFVPTRFKTAQLLDIPRIWAEF
ncbi:hypothetical protein A2U01_0064941, partial [Trifolium medium]|nr:hypothetical protein [Trifolium medium]